jgi:hypothetical protein
LLPVLYVISVNERSGMKADDRHTQATHYTDGSGAYHLRFVGKDVRADGESSSNESTRLVSVPQWVRFRTIRHGFATITNQTRKTTRKLTSLQVLPLPSHSSIPRDYIRQWCCQCGLADRI